MSGIFNSLFTSKQGQFCQFNYRKAILAHQLAILQTINPPRSQAIRTRLSNRVGESVKKSPREKNSTLFSEIIAIKHLYARLNYPIVGEWDQIALCQNQITREKISCILYQYINPFSAQIFSATAHLRTHIQPLFSAASAILSLQAGNLYLPLEQSNEPTYC